MIKVKFLGILRLELGVSELDIEPSVKNVGELVKILANQLNKPLKQIKDNIIFVNDTNIHSLKMFRTQLADNYVVLFLSPVSGG